MFYVYLKRMCVLLFFECSVNVNHTSFVVGYWTVSLLVFLLFVLSVNMRVIPKSLWLWFYFSISFNSFVFFFFPLIFISWRLITLQHCSGFCQALTWISHGVICIPHPDPTSHLPLHSIPLGLPSAPALSTCLMHPTWTGDLFHAW